MLLSGEIFEYTLGLPVACSTRNAVNVHEITFFFLLMVSSRDGKPMTVASLSRDPHDLKMMELFAVANFLQRGLATFQELASFQICRYVKLTETTA